MSRKLPWWSPLSGLFLFAAVHSLARWSLDLRDMPGAAGAQSIYRAAVSHQGQDPASILYRWLQRSLDWDLHSTVVLCSQLSGYLIILGATLAGWAVGGRAAALCS